MITIDLQSKNGVIHFAVTLFGLFEFLVFIIINPIKNPIDILSISIGFDFFAYFIFGDLDLDFPQYLLIQLVHLARV